MPKFWFPDETSPVEVRKREASNGLNEAMWKEANERGVSIMRDRELYLARLVCKGTTQALLECQQDNALKSRQLAVLKAEIARVTRLHMKRSGRWLPV